MRKLFISIGCITLWMFQSCNTELHMFLPEGPAGSSAYEVWKEAVNNGIINWDKTKTDEANFFLYLKGEIGKTGQSAYEQWKEQVATGIENPHSPGTLWAKEKTSLADFWKYLSGAKGQDGITPAIGDNGNWWIGDKDTGIGAQGKDGEDGSDGKNTYELWKENVAKGLDNPHSPGTLWPKSNISEADFWYYLRGTKGDQGEEGNTPYIGDNENWWIGDKDTGIKAQGSDGKDGTNGSDGENGINGESAYELWVKQVQSGLQNPHDPGTLWPSSNISLTDFWYYLQGVKGDKGDSGKDGETPYIGDNGNWWIDGKDTGVKAKGTDGSNGIDGKNANLALTLYAGTRYETWAIDGVNTGVFAEGVPFYIWTKDLIEDGSHSGEIIEQPDGELWPKNARTFADYISYINGGYPVSIP